MAHLQWKLLRYARYHIITDEAKDNADSDLAKWKV